MTEPMGLYIHVPFCVSKCPYCDFYSLPGMDDDRLDAYTAAVEREMQRMHERYTAPADTLYFGGGTPSLLGGKRIARLIEAADRLWGLTDGEITIEANPGDDLQELLTDFASVGGNRLSLGMQAVRENELASLGRRHTHAQTVNAVDTAHRVGLHNISLDVMVGIPHQTTDTAIAAVEEAAHLGATHLSAYLLKIEEGTPFAANRSTLTLPDEEMADRYLAVVKAAAEQGFSQYEISNFAKDGKVSRHNLKYWNQTPYLGIGPSAHSFLDGKRWYYPRDLTAFIEGNHPLPEAPDEQAVADSSPEEYLMLRLRLTEGLTEAGFLARFGGPIPQNWRKRATGLPSSLLRVDDDGIRLTPEGMLVSNAIIAYILDI